MRVEIAAGGAPRQLPGVVDAEKLSAFDVTLDEVAAAVWAEVLKLRGEST